MKLVTWKELKELGLVPYTRQHFERLGRAGTAPVRRKFRNRAVWVLSEVQAWQERFQLVQADTVP
jgi:predicted DNA-binding transcriptional regulator AlpA